MEKDKENKNEVKKTRRVGKILLFILALLLLASLVSGGVYIYLKTTNERDSVSSATYIGMFEDGTYYIPKAKKNIRFQIESEDISSYKLTDKNNNRVETKIAKKAGQNYIQALENYQEGETYTLELINTSFSEELLKDAKKLQFRIETPAKAEYEYNDNVKTIKERLDIKEEGDVKTLEVGNLAISQNDIILANDYAYKVDTIKNGIATLSIPQPAELYKNLEMHGEQVVDFTNFTVNPEFEKEIKVSIEKSPIYQFLVSECYAANIQESQIVQPTKDGLRVEIKITLKANGKEYLGIKALANHDLTLKFTIDLSCKTNEDILKDNYINLDLAITEKFNFDIELKSTGTIVEGIGKLSDEEYCRTIQDIVAKLENASTDKSSGSVFLGDALIPTQIPFVYIKADVFLQRALELQVNFRYNQTVEASQNIGFVFDANGIQPYFQVNAPKTSSEMTVLGKAYAELGAGFDIGLQILSADVMVRTEGGLYAELFAGMDVSYNNTNKSLNENFVGKIETGIYFRNKISASLDLFFWQISKEKQLTDVKIPILKLGNDEIITGITAKSTTVTIGDNNHITLPTIMKNIKNLDSGATRQEECTNNLSLTDENGNEIPLSGSLATLSKNENTVIQITYNENGRMYRTQITAKKKSTSSNTGSRGEIVGENTYSEASNAYKTYIRNKKYVSKTSSWMKEAETYCIFDINQDGVEELLIMSENDWGWRNTLIYTYVSENVKFITDIYSYGEIRYDKDEKEIVYTELKPYIDVGIYGFYQLKNNEFVHSKSVGYEEQGKYIIYTEKGGKKSITKEQSETYFKELYYFSFSKLSNV